MIALALLRFLRRTPWSTLMALVGVALGVTSIVSVHLISASIARQLDGLVPQTLAGYTHFLHREEFSADDYFALRRSWRSGLLPTVTRIAPFIDETVELDARVVRVIGIDLVSNFSDLADARAVAGESEFDWQGVWVDASLVDVVTQPVNGVIEAGQGTLVGDISVAQDLLDFKPQQLSYVGINVTSPWAGIKRTADKLLPGFSAGLPQTGEDAISIDGWQVTSIAQQHPANQFGKSVLFNISALGLLAMLVAWFVMYQVAVSWLRRLWPVFTRLHVLGVQWQALRNYFLGAMLLLGGLAALLGLVCGQKLAQWLYGLATSQSDISFELQVEVVGKAFVSALGVSLLGGAWAFRQAQQAALPIFKRRILLWLVLAALAIFGIVAESSGLMGGFISIAVLSVATALLAAPLLQWMRGRAHRIGGPYLARLSVREAVWYPRDLAVAIAGLVLAIATAIGVGLMIDSFRQDFTRMLEQRLSYDIVVRGDSLALRELTDTAKTLTGVKRVQPYAVAQERIQGMPVELVVTRLDAIEQARYGFAGHLEADAVLLSEQGLRALGLNVGEHVQHPSGDLRIAAKFSSFGDVMPRLIVGADHPLAASGTRLESVSLNVTDPQTQLAMLQSRFANLEFQLQSDIRQQALLTFDRTFTITTVLIVLAMLVGAIGVYVAVTTLRLNRRFGERLMENLGISYWETRGMDFALGMGVGLVAVVLALPLGLAFGWVLCSVVNPRAFGWTVTLQLSPLAVLWPIFWGLLAAAVAGVVRLGRGELALARVS